MRWSNESWGAEITQLKAKVKNEQVFVDFVQFPGLDCHDLFLRMSMNFGV